MIRSGLVEGRVLPLLFFFSGASSLIFETIFTRLLTYTFGNTAHAVSTVLAAFLGGLALGAYVLGRWADRKPASLLAYGVLELLVGIYCFFIPQEFSLITSVYVALYERIPLGLSAQAGLPSLTAVRFGLASLVILPASFLMGGTLPVLARYVVAARHDFEAMVSRLYAWNTLGAALGTLASAYFLMPGLGVRGTIWTACGTNLALFICVVGLGRKGALSAASVPRDPEPRAAQQRGKSFMYAAFLIGAVALAYEVVWSHALGFLVGNTVYAFGLMLFTFLCGLGWGAQIVANHFRQASRWVEGVVGSQLGVGLAVFLTLPLWTRVPDVFAGGLARIFLLDILGISVLAGARMVFDAREIGRALKEGRMPALRVAELVILIVALLAAFTATSSSLWRNEACYFVASELLRFLCAFSLLIAPCLLLGLGFPLLLNLASGSEEHAGRSVGGVYAANTVGAIFGSAITGFVVLPRLGTLGTLRAAATANLALALVFALKWLPRERMPRRVSALAAVTVAGLVWLAPVGWEAKNLARGTYVYFNPGWRIERILFQREDIQGGLSSVVQVGASRVLLSNGKFQGDDSGEVGAQARFALVPILLTHAFDRALVIGLGTGHTLRVVSRFPFAQIDAVEIAPAIVEAARQHFERVNDCVFDRDPRVKLTVADGRNFLLLSKNHYDLITLEITSIWISGEADLYNKEFYELCRAHMTERGVLQQWVQIHHMRTSDFLVILNTAAQVFPHVAFFLGPEQGVLIASRGPLEADFNLIEKHDADPDIRRDLTASGLPSFASLLGELMLADASLREAVSHLPAFNVGPADFVSTDFNPRLEYGTPRGNVLPYSTVPPNINFMMKFRPPVEALGVGIRNLPSENERNLVLGFIAAERDDVGAALEYFARVGGPRSKRAQAEISRIKSSPHPRGLKWRVE